ncbi:MAG: chemotaxis protein CheA [Aquabacterium sp.]|uniref:chemotaxis protein CheA n=1 Tax=Aquabacterium sp. TaxID=1872578 RepID=UPI001DA8E46D|nr:chemotaxis protein CheA [Aquabacterium sp.]MBT9608546.1 chemotaxis protein CheA [Aquabacterium sp.]
MAHPHDDTDQSFIAEALPAFISEAQEQIEQVEQLLLQLEDAPDDAELLNALFRCAHTVKGSAGVFGLDAVVAFTHHVESLLDGLREGRQHLTPAMSTLLLQCNDQIRLLVDAASDLACDVSSSEGLRQQLVAELQRWTDGGAPMPSTGASDAPAQDAPQAQPWHIGVRFGRDTFRNGMDPLAILNYLRGLGELDDVVLDESAVPALAQLEPESCHLDFGFTLLTDAAQAGIEDAFSFVREDCELCITPPAAALDAACAALGNDLAEAPEVLRSAPVQATPPADARKPKARDGAEDGRFIRVQADRLDAVINLLGELVVASAGASMLARETRQGTLIEANGHMERLIEEIRNGTLQLRMVPIGETFSRFRRVVRDVAADLHKDVVLEIQGGETELDKSMVERIADPLMHLVRNALDHGLETPEERTAAGKPAQGQLTLSACHESGHVLIRIRDDGRGISRQRVLQKAWDRGLVEPGVTPPDADILKLIFEPGFSTAEQVTNLSGRGVGMDVVRQNIEALRGRVQIASEPGEGTDIDIRLPLTLAIIDGFLIGVGDSRFIFPLESVVEVIQGDGLGQSIRADGRCCMELRGQVLPVMSLSEVYGLDCAPAARPSVVVIQSAGRQYGVLVDVLMGHYQTVIKPLSRMFRSLRGISGSSILGNGDVALIFDVHALGDLAAAERMRRPTRSVSSPQLPLHSRATPDEGASHGLHS